MIDIIVTFFALLVLFLTSVVGFLAFISGIGCLISGDYDRKESLGVLILGIVMLLPLFYVLWNGP
jgi:divalent metal cation (Fe/Co/Zn/Cd) transporter